MFAGVPFSKHGKPELHELPVANFPDERWPRNLAKLALWAAGLFLLSACGMNAFASTFRWVESTASERAMTSYAKAPGAPAIILSYDEEDDALSSEVLVHVRIKVLTEGGRSAGNVEFPDYVAMNPYSNSIYGRTIHPNGSVAMFTGKLKQMARNGASTRSVMGLPDVETGSILEYGYHVAALDDSLSYSGSLQAQRWQVQQAYHVCAAHFVLRTAGMDRASVRWVSNIPAGFAVRWIKNRVELDVSDVAPLPNEEFTPPVSSLKSQVRFFYWTGASGPYWGRTGDSVDSAWKDFYSPTKELIGAVNQIISPADTDEQKLRRIYDAVTALENTDLTRERSEREDRQAGFKEAKKSQDIWRRRRGNSQELALLFVAFARAAGFNAYPMGVTSRDSAIFNPEVLSWSQIDSTIVVINWKGQVHFLDPGCRGCPYGHLAWWHSNVHGVSFEGKQIVFRETPLEPASANQTLRAAELKLDEQGAVTGTVTMRFADNATIPFRRQLLREDQQAVEAALEKDLQEEMPVGVQTKLLSLDIPADYSSVIVARFSVTGTLGTTVGKRLMLPAHLFASTSKPLLTPVSRTLPISFAEEYALKDVVRIQLPASLAVESLPQSRALKLAKDVDFTISASKTDHTVRIERFYVLYRLDYPVDEYPALHSYFAQVADANQEQLVLQPVKP